MAADTPLKRYSAMNIGSPWRGQNVYPSGSVNAGERQAAMYLYALNEPASGSTNDGNMDRIIIGATVFGQPAGITIGFGL